MYVYCYVIRNLQGLLDVNYMDFIPKQFRINQHFDWINPTLFFGALNCKSPSFDLPNSPQPQLLQIIYRTLKCWRFGRFCVSATLCLTPWIKFNEHFLAYNRLLMVPFNRILRRVYHYIPQTTWNDYRRRLRNTTKPFFAKLLPVHHHDVNPCFRLGSKGK